MAKSSKHATGAPVEFQAELVALGNNLGWTVAYVPLDLAELWGTRGQVRVKGEINGFPVRTSLFPTGRGTHYLLVNKAMQKGANVKRGMTARFRLERDTAERKLEMPAELARELAQDRALRKYYEALNFSTRRDIARHVAEPRSAEARARRAGKCAERLMTALLGESGELPPILQVALRQNPKARAGWEAMPPSHRRAHLLALTAYASPESRARRLQKAIQEMVGYAGRREQRAGRAM